MIVLWGIVQTSPLVSSSDCYLDLVCQAQQKWKQILWGLCCLGLSASRWEGRVVRPDDPWTLPYRSMYLQNWTNFQRFSEDNSSNFEGTGFSDICALVVKLGTAACIAINWLCTAWWLPVHPPQDLSWRSSRCTQNKTKPTDFINLSLSADSSCLKFLTVWSFIIP